MKDNECLLLHREEESKKRVGRNGWGRVGGMWVLTAEQTPFSVVPQLVGGRFPGAEERSCLLMVKLTPIKTLLYL